MEKSLDPLCPSIQAALGLLSRPWTGLVLAVLQDGPLRFSELATRISAIGDKTLSARLKELEAKGLVVRDVQPGPPIRVAYQLTPKGAAFRKVVEAIDTWGQQFLEPGENPQRSPERIPLKENARRRSGARKAK
ncbi:winged helix-turn-helix transcriptional regulator [Hyalangium versicolor]|uniref:winged helix-turn-helix transcriptional regulator n=1 Tax=Hyalangium versicolor TaxID=2861190 RepID=UPI001CCB15E7|nr:helix-turn-helix domain-containing protein [Hyalangium versicolor]